MSPHHLLQLLSAVLLLLLPPLLSQQPYVRNDGLYCSVTTPSSLGFTCNGLSTSCTSYLSFRSPPPTTSLRSLSLIPTATAHLLLAPVHCSCSGHHYQHNASYTVSPSDTLMLIANTTFQGLSTCQAIATQNSISDPQLLLAGSTIVVPLRCACPTRAQVLAGVKYLLSYLVDWDDFVYDISQRFRVDMDSVLSANDLTVDNATIYPFTTLLVPLKAEPNLVSLAPSPTPDGGSGSVAPTHKSRTWVYVVIGVGAACLVLVVSVMLVCWRNEVLARKRFDEMPKKAPEVQKEIFLHIPQAVGGRLKEYQFEELRKATEDFGTGRAIGRSVFRGVFGGDMMAAVKRVRRDVSKEVEILKRINHSNLIGLYGFCFHKGEWLLVYEYAENGCLGDWLFDGSGLKVLGWIGRVKIALDVAHGLSYLHNYAIPSCVHKDINCFNVLLDGKFKAKIANFGLARPVEAGEDEPVLTRRIVGTQGYMAPEYLMHGVIGPKLDVYAFGVVLMEMVTGKEVGIMDREGGDFSKQKLLEVFVKEGENEELMEWIDPLLNGDYPLPCVCMMARLAADCLRSDAVERPSMVEIVQSLFGILANSMSWFDARSSEEPQSSSSRVEERSKKDGSFSMNFV